MRIVIELFLLFILLQRGHCTVKKTYWRQVFLAINSFDDSSVESSEVSSPSDISCSLLASKTVGTNLFCFKDELCRLSNLTVVPSYHNVTGEGLLDCRTKFQELCPSNFQKIDNKCYSIGIVRKNIFTAKQDCLNQGAILAQPDLTTEAIKSLVNGLVLQFPSELESITAGKEHLFEAWLWLGVIEEGPVGDFKYLNREGGISSDSPLIFGMVDNVQEALTLIFRGSNKYLVDRPPSTRTRHYICQTPMIYWKY